MGGMAFFLSSCWEVWKHAHLPHRMAPAQKSKKICNLKELRYFWRTFCAVLDRYLIEIAKNHFWTSAIRQILGTFFYTSLSRLSPIDSDSSNPLVFLPLRIHPNFLWDSHISCFKTTRFFFMYLVTRLSLYFFYHIFFKKILLSAIFILNFDCILFSFSPNIFSTKNYYNPI